VGGRRGGDGCGAGGGEGAVGRRGGGGGGRPWRAGRLEVGGSGGGGGGGSATREVRVVAASLRRGWEEETEDAVLDQCGVAGSVAPWLRLGGSPLTRCVQQTRPIGNGSCRRP
jgi:hypothetical protein